jgi:hypothetical protein
MPKPRVRVVNMIPNSMSGETNQDSEPQLTVNHEHYRMILGTAFTPDPGGGPDGPIYASLDGGENWTLDLVIPGEAFFIPVGQVMPTIDQSIRFGGGSALYAGILRTDNQALDVLRSAPYSPSTVMQILTSRTAIDQPYVETRHAEHKDRVFVGNNDAISGPFRGSVEHSADARHAPPPAGFNQSTLDQRTPFNRELPSIRAASHHDGTVYVAYLSVRQYNPTNTQCDVVVARDDHFATGPAPFTALIDSGDGLPGVRVAKSVPVPWTSPFSYLGNERVGSSLSIVVDPKDHRVVYVAWGGGPDPGSTVTLHVQRSTDRGATWSGDLLTVQNATNPALAMTDDGKLGFLYQQLVLAGGGSQRWETHVQTTHNGWATPAEDILLASTPDDGSIHTWDPYIGDYADLQAVNRDFYGIFSADNVPILSNFPHGVRYQRNADFSTNQLLDVNNITPVANSIDPFFFHIAWHRESEEEEEPGWVGRERLEIRGLRYERLEVEEIKLEVDGLSGRVHWHSKPKRLHGAGHAIRWLAHRIEDLAERLAREHHHDDDED